MAFVITSTTDAVINMPAPQDKHQLRSFLGHMFYICKHVQDLPKARASLDSLLKPDVKFVWEAQHQEAFILSRKQCSLDTF